MTKMLKEYKFNYNRFIEENEEIDEPISEDVIPGASKDITELIEELSEIVSKEDLGTILIKIGQFMIDSGNSLNVEDSENSEETSEEVEGVESDEDLNDDIDDLEERFNRQDKPKIVENSLAAALGGGNATNWANFYSELNKMITLPQKSLKAAVDEFKNKVRDLPKNILSALNAIISTNSVDERKKLVKTMQGADQKSGWAD